MSLNFPHQYSGNDQVSRATSHDNLDKLVTAVKVGQKLSREDVVTQEAIACFNFIKANSNGCGHRCKKYTAVLGSWTIGAAAPFGALALLSGYMYNRSECLHGLVNRENLAHVSNACLAETKSLLTDHSYISTSLASMIALELAVQKIGHFSLISPITNGLATGYALLVNTLIKGVARSYDNDSAKREELNKEKYKEGIENSRKTWDGMADILYARFNEVRNTPSELLSFQNETNELLAAYSQFITGLTNWKINSADIDSILNKFKSTLEKIRDEKIALRSGSNEQDIAYNANLLTHFPITAEHCIPAKAQQHIAAAKAHELGLWHTAKQCVATTVAGALSFAAVPAATFASTFMCSKSPVSFIPDLSTSGFCASAQGPLASMQGSLKSSWDAKTFVVDQNTVGVAAAGVVLGALVTNGVSNSYAKEREDHDRTVNELHKMAKTETVNTYDNIARHFRQQLSHVKNDTAKLNHLKDEVEILVSKLEDISKEIANSGIRDLSAEAATNELQNVLADIMIA